MHFTGLLYLIRYSISNVFARETDDSLITLTYGIDAGGHVVILTQRHSSYRCILKLLTWPCGNTHTGTKTLPVHAVVVDLALW